VRPNLWTEKSTHMGLTADQTQNLLNESISETSFMSCVLLLQSCQSQKLSDSTNLSVLKFTVYLKPVLVRSVIYSSYLFL
jgi:hypothetical protein